MCSVGEMGGEGCAGRDVLKVSDGADNAVIKRKEAVSSAVKLFGITSRQTLFEHFDTMESKEFLPFGSTLKTCEKVYDAILLGLQAMDEPLGDRSRCLERFVRDEVEDGDVACMTDTGEDRQFELRTDRTKRITVETTEIRRSSAASDDGDAVERTGFAC